MWNELGISGGTAIVILIALYFVIKWAVKNGVKEAYKDITGKKPVEDEKNEKELEGLVNDSQSTKNFNQKTSNRNRSMTITTLTP